MFKKGFRNIKKRKNYPYSANRFLTVYRTGTGYLPYLILNSNTNTYRTYIPMHSTNAVDFSGLFVHWIKKNFRHVSGNAERFGGLNYKPIYPVTGVFYFS